MPTQSDINNFHIIQYEFHYHHFESLARKLYSLRFAWLGSACTIHRRFYRMTFSKIICACPHCHIKINGQIHPSMNVFDVDCSMVEIVALFPIAGLCWDLIFVRTLNEKKYLYKHTLAQIVGVLGNRLVFNQIICHISSG